MMQGGPGDGEIPEVRAVLTGHGDGPRVRRSANVWHLDTGADFPAGKLAIAQIDTDPMKFTTVRASDHAPRKPETLGQVLGGRRQREGGDKSMTGARELGARVETEQANAALVVLIECERSGRSTEAVAHEWASQMCDAARAGDEKADVYDTFADEAIVRAACEEAEERTGSERSGPETAEQGETTCAQARADHDEIERLRSEVKSASKAEERGPEALARERARALRDAPGSEARARHDRLVRGAVTRVLTAHARWLDSGDGDRPPAIIG